MTSSSGANFSKMNHRSRNWNNIRSLVLYINKCSIQSLKCHCCHLIWNCSTSTLPYYSTATTDSMPDKCIQVMEPYWFCFILGDVKWGHRKCQICHGMLMKENIVTERWVLHSVREAYYVKWMWKSSSGYHYCSQVQDMIIYAYPITIIERLS